MSPAEASAFLPSQKITGNPASRPGELVGVEGAFIEGLLGIASGFAFGVLRKHKRG